jgi:hypothetical protein
MVHYGLGDFLFISTPNAFTQLEDGDGPRLTWPPCVRGCGTVSGGWTAGTARQAPCSGNPID